MNFYKFLDYLVEHDYHLIILYIILGILVYKIFSFFTEKWTKKANKKRKATIQKLLRNIFKYMIIILVSVQVLNVLGINVTGIAAGLGIAGVILGLALQDVMKDVLSGLSIIFEEQFDVGDFIKLNNYEGTVIDLGLKSTKLKTYENIIITIANRNISEVINYSKENINVKISIPIPYDIDTKKADKVVDNIIKRIAKEIDLTGEISNWGINNFNASDIEYTILVPVKSSEQWNAKRKSKRIIKEEFDKEKISIPFNTIEVRNG